MIPPAFCFPPNSPSTGNGNNSPSFWERKIQSYSDPGKLTLKLLTKRTEVTHRIAIILKKIFTPSWTARNQRRVGSFFTAFKETGAVKQQLFLEHPLKTVFHDSILAGNMCVIHGLLYAGFAPAFTHFLSALEKGHTQLFLLMLNCTTCALDLDKLLLLACGATGNKEVALALIEKGADLAATDAESGNSPLHEACMYGHNTLVLEIIKRDLSTLHKRNINGLYPMNYAIPRCSKQVIYAMGQENAPCHSSTAGPNPLLYAVAAGNIEEVGQILNHTIPQKKWGLLQARVNLTPEDPHETRTVISEAIDKAFAGNKYEDIALLLLQQAGHCREPKKLLTEDTLFIAACNGLYRVIEEILKSPHLNVEEKQVLLDYRSPGENATPIEFAAMNDWRKCFQLLMNLDPKLAEKDQEIIGTVAHNATIHDWKEELDTLLQKVRLALNEPQPSDENPLLPTACWKGCSRVAEFLIEKGADLTVKDFNKETPIEVAAKRCDSKIVSLIFSKIDKEKLPSWITSPRDDGVTLLHQAFDTLHADSSSEISRQSFDEFLPLLLDPLTPEQKTIFIDTKTQKTDKTALHLALELEFVEDALLLLQHGADVTIPNSEERTALHIAASRGLNDAIEPLLDQNAFIDASDEQAATPLLLACQNGHLATAETLIKHGADVTITDSGPTILQIAAQNGWTGIVEFILAKKDLKEAIVKKEGSKALVLACEKGHFLVAGTLLQNGAEVDREDYAAMSRALFRMDAQYPLTQSIHKNIYSKMAKEFVQDPITTLQKGLNPLVFFNTETLYNETVSDKKLLLREGGKEYVYWVNSKLLAARSDYFSKLFNGSYKEGKSTTSTMEMHDVDPRSFLTILQYLYVQNIRVTHDSFKPLAKISSQLSLLDLQKELNAWLHDHPECQNWAKKLDLVKADRLHSRKRKANELDS